MATRIPEHIIADIRDRVSIREVVEDYLTLKKDGANHKGLCPFHEEKTPSFKVHEGKGIYKCFGCGASGNVFGFLMQVDGMSFPEAVERLAGRAGIELPKVELTPEQKQEEDDRGRLLTANEIAAEFYHKFLIEADAARPAREYLDSRGTSAETIARYRLGYSPPGWENLVAAVKGKGASQGELHRVGLIIESDRGGYYDRFRGRLMFPILDVQGRVRGFGGRLIEDDKDQPKYINSPESPVYNKGSGFYGLYQAKESIRKRQRALVVEGYFDQIALDQAGINYAVATLGTALTANHARMLRRYSTDVFLVFDADEAGRRAAVRSLESFLASGVSPRIVVIPEGKDPDDFMRLRGADDFEKLLDASPPLLSYYMDQLLAEAGDTPAEVARAVSEAASMVGRVQDRIEQGMFAERLSRKSGVGLKDVQARIRRPEKRDGPPGEDGKPAGFDMSLYPKAELEFIRLVLHHPETAPTIADSGALEKFQRQELAGFLTKMIEQYKDGQKADPAILLEDFSDRGLVDWISRVIFENDPFGDKAASLVGDLARGVLRGEIESRLTRVRREIEMAQHSGDEGRWRSLLQAQKDLLFEQRRLSA